MIRAGRYRADIVSLDGWLGYHVTDTTTGASLGTWYVPGATSRTIRREALDRVTRLHWQSQTEAA